MDFNFLKPDTNAISCQAHFCTWEGLSNLCSALLTGYFQRPVFTQAVGDDHSDAWSLKLTDAPLSEQELHTLLDSLHADDCDRDANDFGEYPIWELSQSIGRKLLTMALPFPVEASHAADDGVWFTGSTAVYAVTVIRQRIEGLHTELYESCYLIDRERLSAPSGEACEAYLRKIISDFLQTEAGARAYEETCRDFNWGDVVDYIPNEFFAAYGVRPYNFTPGGAGRFLCCGMIGILVDQDELLGYDILEE